MKNIIESWKHIPYTFSHYIAFMKLQKQLLGYYKYKFHDLDKILMYLFLPFFGTKKIKTIHKKFNKHHIVDYKNQEQCNYEEAIIDWECARFTKKDKPENARENAEKPKFKNTKHYPELLKQLEKFKLMEITYETKYPICKESPYNVGDIRVLPKGTEVWSLEYQTRISFSEDEIIEVTNTTVHGDLFFGKLKQVIGQTMFPGLIGKGVGEIETYFSKTTDFTLPEPGIVVQMLIAQNKETK